MTVSEVTNLPSIQGEQEKAQAGEQMSFADEWEVDSYVDAHSDGVVQCRMDFRHQFELPRNGVTFSAVDDYGNFIAEYPCQRCGCAYRREVWGTYKVKREVRFELLDTTIQYKRNQHGETYGIAPGSPRMKPRQVRASVMTQAMKGQSPAAMRKAIQRMQAGD